MSKSCLVETQFFLMTVFFWISLSNSSKYESRVGDLGE